VLAGTMGRRTGEFEGMREGTDRFSEYREAYVSHLPTTPSFLYYSFRLFNINYNNNSNITTCR
jgi:hypothetical protein